MRSIRDLFSLILAMTVLQTAGGMLSLLIPLALDGAGAGPSVIGLVQAGHSVGFMTGALFATSLVRRMGQIRAYSAAAAACAALTLALYMRIDPAVWAVIRAGQGFCFVLMFASAESWLAVAAPAQSRGSVLGAYQVATKLALLGGPFLIIGLAPTSASPYMVAAAVLALALIPMCATRQIEPAPPPMQPFSVLRLWRIAPAAVIAAFSVGAINGGVMALLPVYAARLEGGVVTAAASLNAAVWIGGVALQWQAGRLSDRRDRRLVIAGLAGIAAIGATGLAILGAGAPLLPAMLLAGLWGVGALSIYGVAVAHAADAAQDQTPRAIALMLLIWATGAMAGPPLAGVLMGALGPAGLFGGAAIGGVLLAGAMIVRTRIAAATPTEEKARFETAPATSPEIARVDPRGPDWDGA